MPVSDGHLCIFLWVKATASLQVILAVLEMEGGEQKLHFRRNLEVLVLVDMLGDESGSTAPMLADKTELFGLAVSLLSKMVNRVVADGITKLSAGQNAAPGSLGGLEGLSRACQQHPRSAVEAAVQTSSCEGVAKWDCTSAYSAYERMSVVFQVASCVA